MTAREAGLYHDIEMYWASSLVELDNLFTVVDPRVETLLNAYMDEKNDGESYQDWLTYQALPINGDLYMDEGVLAFEHPEPKQVIRDTLSFLRKTGELGVNNYHNGNSFRIEKDYKMADGLNVLAGLPLEPEYGEDYQP